MSSNKNRYGDVKVFRDDGMVWDSVRAAEDDCWLKPGVVDNACRTGEKVLGHRYWLFRSKGEGGDDVRIDHNQALQIISMAVNRVAVGGNPDSVYNDSKRQFDECSRRVFD